MRAIVSMDAVGRLVLPKEIRQAIGISGRTKVMVEVVSSEARISACEPPPRNVVQTRGRLVYAGALPRDWDSSAAVLQIREGRLRR